MKLPFEHLLNETERKTSRRCWIQEFFSGFLAEKATVKILLLGFSRPQKQQMDLH
jgi:hypothetical protein